MGIRTMVSPNRVQGPHFPPLAKQGSLYNLTFEEVQTQLGNVGKPLNGMNIEGQVMQNPPSSSSASSFFPVNANMNGVLCKKMADEIWKDIVHHEHVINGADNPSAQQQFTLEDFLVRAGVINVDNQDGILNHQPLMAVDPITVVSQQADWLQSQQQQQQMTALDSNFHVSESVYESPVVDVGFSDNRLVMPMPMPPVASTPLDSQATVERKRRYSDEMLEKTIERRQKRMIKNRESAARSRARKQAYTNQLEHEVLQLRKTNSWLKKRKEVETKIYSNPIPMPKYQLRRTSSTPF